MSDLLTPWVPSADDPFDLRKAGHLVRRAALGGSLGLRRRMVRRGVDWSIEQVIAPAAGEDVDEVLEDVVAFDDPERLRAYRVWRALVGRHRLRETMSLFWHGHFATSIEKVRSTRMMAGQLERFDRHGLGRFDQLLLEASRDPAMIRWLDNDTNVAGKANENFARELFELFALGRGCYTERDIQEAARAFTGWHMRDERFQFVPRFHDDGEKEVFGKRGRFGGEDVVAMTAARSDSARFVAAKLLAHFVHPAPTAAEIDALAALYTRRKRHLRETVEALLRSRLFFSERAYRSRIKSPVDLAVGTVRSVGGRVAPKALEKSIGRLGQVLLAPPSVEGWHGERAWLTSATWLLRANFAAEMFAGRGGFALQPGADALLDDAETPIERADLAVVILLDGDLAPERREDLHRFAGSRAARGPGGSGALFHAVSMTPEAQLL